MACIINKRWGRYSSNDHRNTAKIISNITHRWKWHVWKTYM